MKGQGVDKNNPVTTISMRNKFNRNGSRRYLEISYCGQLIIYLILDTDPVVAHGAHIFLIDLQHLVSVSEATLLSRTPRLHISNLKALPALVDPQVETKPLSLQPL